MSDIYYSYQGTEVHLTGNMPKIEHIREFILVKTFDYRGGWTNNGKCSIWFIETYESEPFVVATDTKGTVTAWAEMKPRSEDEEVTWPNIIQASNRLINSIYREEIKNRIRWIKSDFDHSLGWKGALTTEYLDETYKKLLKKLEILYDLRYYQEKHVISSVGEEDEAFARQHMEERAALKGGDIDE